MAFGRAEAAAVVQLYRSECWMLPSWWGRQIAPNSDVAPSDRSTANPSAHDCDSRPAPSARIAASPPADCHLETAGSTLFSPLTPSCVIRRQWGPRHPPIVLLRWQV